MFTRSRRSTAIWLFLNRLPLILIIIFLLQLASCHKNTTDPPKYCPPSSCGNIQNITYPFRLDTDPPNCDFSSFSRDPNFILYCHNNSSLFLYLNNTNKNLVGGRFLVKGINYDNYTIHLVDPGVQQHNCSSLPISPISLSSFYDDSYYSTYLSRKGADGLMFYAFSSRVAVLISCDQTQVNYSTSRVSWYHSSYNSYFVEMNASSCKSKRHSYLIVGAPRVYLEQVKGFCSIDMMTLISLPSTNDNFTSYQEIHTQFSHGFLLSWSSVSCQPNCNGTCYLDEANGPTCQPSFRDVGQSVVTQYYEIDIWINNYIYAGYHALRWYWDPMFNTLGWLINISMLLGAIRVVITLVGGTCFFIFLIYHWRRRHLSLYNTIEEFLQNQNDLVPIRYSYKDIKKVTSCFKEKIGEGGFGCVYKGKLRSGRLAAIKILSKSSKVTNGQDFMNEVSTLGRIHHVNVVQLVGYCAEQSKRALVYDFMSNGSLDKYIFAKENYVSLTWDKLFEISLGVARGIEYLHRGCDIQILHFDIKPHNILLDENFIPKISDFGLAKLYSTMKDTIASLTAARGTIGYMAPELFYKNIGRVSYKADVYSFGMLLLEIAGKRKSLNALVEKSSQIYFPSWVYDQVSKGDSIEIGDNATQEEIKLVKKLIIVGLWCIQMNPINRPSMNKVLEMLEGDVDNLEMPPKPTLYQEEMPKVAETNESSSMSDNSSESISLIESEG